MILKTCYIFGPGELEPFLFHFIGPIGQRAAACCVIPLQALRENGETFR